MTEYIKRKEAQAAFKSVTEDCTCPLHIAAEIDQILDQVPASDVVTVVRGHWIEKMKPDRFEFKRNCSVCNGGSDLATNYCPNCGAYMRG